MVLDRAKGRGGGGGRASASLGKRSREKERKRNRKKRLGSVQRPCMNIAMQIYRGAAQKTLDLIEKGGGRRGVSVQLTIYS